MLYEEKLKQQSYHFLQAILTRGAIAPSAVKPIELPH
jgi:hypothetical protein